MDPRHRKEILGQWGVREENARERAERETLERELEGGAVPGPADRASAASSSTARPRATSPRAAARSRTWCGSARSRARSTVTRRDSASVWRDLAFVHRGDPAGFARGWSRIAERWDFGGVNELIAKHNRFYPAEARLPMDVGGATSRS